MKRFFLTMLIMSMFMACNCNKDVDLKSTQPQISNVNTSVKESQGKISIVDHWVVRSPSGLSKDMIAVTFVVKNNTSTDANIYIICNFVDDGSLFGRSVSQTIKANSDAKLMVRGFIRCPSGIECNESFDCKVELTK